MKNLLLVAFFTVTLVYSQTSYNVTLYGQMDKYTGGSGGNDYSEVWGWTDTVKKREYAFIGTSSGTSVVDITTLPLKEVSAIPGPNSTYNYHEFRTYKNYLYIGAEGSNTHPLAGLQIVDLSPLPDSTSFKKTYVWIDSQTTTAYRTTHTVSIEKNFLYLNGGTFGGTRILDISDPLNPLQAGSYGKGSLPYVHDAIIVNDTLYASCINAGTLDIVDFTQKSHITKSNAGPKLVSSTPTVPEQRTHQAWLSENRNYLFVATEATGQNFTYNLHIYDITNRTNPIQISTWTSDPDKSIHNVFAKGDFLYIAYYSDGFRILDISNPYNPIEVGFYKTYANSNPPLFCGAWGVYPYFPSGKVAVSDMNTGLYIFTVDLKHGGNVTGIVRDAVTNVPMGSVQVKVLETGRTYSTSAGSGIYKYGNAEGLHNVVFSKTGYIADTLSITTHAGTTDTVYVYLQPASAAGIEKQNDVVPSVFNLAQNFPNPFNPNTTISFSVESDNFTTLRVYNALGQEITLLVDQKLSRGTYSVSFNAAHLPSGLYFYTLHSGSFTSTKKMILTK